MQFFDVTSWKDLEVFDRDDVAEWFESNHTHLKQVIQKRLGYIVEYVRYNVILDSTTMRDIMGTVNAVKTDATETVVTSKSGSEDSVKKSVPTVAKFSGVDEDFFTWRDNVINDLGKHGLGRYVLNDDAHSLSPMCQKECFIPYGVHLLRVLQAIMRRPCMMTATLILKNYGLV